MKTITKQKLNNRQRMRESNRRVREWMLENKFDQIYFKAHTKRTDLIYTQKGNYRAIDLWNLFDGICFNELNEIVFFQVKTNLWAKPIPINEFCEKYGLVVLSFNVKKDPTGKWDVLMRAYQ